MPRDNNQFALAAHTLDLHPRLCFSNAQERRGVGNRIHRARWLVLRLQGCGAEVTVMDIVVEDMRTADAGDVCRVSMLEN